MPSAFMSTTNNNFGVAARGIYTHNIYICNVICSMYCMYVPDPFYRSMPKKQCLSIWLAQVMLKQPPFPPCSSQIPSQEFKYKMTALPHKHRNFTPHPTAQYVDKNWCRKASTIHQVSRYINHQVWLSPSDTSVLTQEDLLWGGKIFQLPKTRPLILGPQTARLCDEIGRTFQVFCWKIWTTNWMIAFYISLVFFVSISTDINHSILSTVWEAGKSPGICIFCLENIFTPNGPSMIQKSKGIRINAQNLPSKMTSRLSSIEQTDFKKRTNNSISDCNLPCQDTSSAG